MIETEHPFVISVGIDEVWGYVKDINKWAELFPGCRSCQIIDDNNSKWLIKVGAGGMVKTVNVLVHVARWDAPGRVDFQFKLESEPVVGSGSYIATRNSDTETQVRLQVSVEGSGQMAPMWEAMSRPLLPQMARSFGGKLKAEIEGAAGVVLVPRPSMFHAFGQWLRRLWQTLFGSGSNK